VLWIVAGVVDIRTLTSQLSLTCLYRTWLSMASLWMEIRRSGSLTARSCTRSESVKWHFSTEDRFIIATVLAIETRRHREIEM